MKFKTNYEMLNDICQPSDVLSEEGLQQVTIPRDLLLAMCERVQNDVNLRRTTSFNIINELSRLRREVTELREDEKLENTYESYEAILQEEITKVRVQRMFGDIFRSNLDVPAPSFDDAPKVAEPQTTP